MTNDPKTLVSTQWLADNLSRPDICVLDASYFLPNVARDARSEYNAAHIPGARFFGIDDISDGLSALPHMVPRPDQFAQQVGALGVGDQHQVVVYDSQGLFSAARVWWLFRVMGKSDVAVLDGGLPKWRNEARAMHDHAAAFDVCMFHAQFNDDLIYSLSQIAAVAEHGTHPIIDARSRERFAGRAQEPRPGMRSGHIPGARNLPYADLLNPDFTLKAPSELRTLFEKAGVDLSQKLVTTCGSGITAAILNLALARIGHNNNALYDGSWAEWGAQHHLPIATGEPQPC